MHVTGLECAAEARGLDRMGGRRGQGHGAAGLVHQVNKFTFHFQFKGKLAIDFQYMRDVI